MAIGRAALIPFLRKVHLFRGLDDEQLAHIAARLQEHSIYEAGEAIFRQGEYGEDLFLIYEGQVELLYRKKGETHSLTILTSGDFFGEEAILTQRPYRTTAKALQTCRLLRLARRDFQDLLKIAPRLRAHLEVAVSSRGLAQHTRFPWLPPNENIYFLARKHPLQLWKALGRPAFLALVGCVLVGALYLVVPSPWLLLAVGLWLIACLLWGAWNYLNWSNDYYLVTNQRVAWVERVMGIYDSRQEAPLTTILSVGVETGQLGRFMDFGDVIVRTFVGRIVFNEVRHPYEAAAMIEEYWTRSREAARKTDLETMQRTIREKLRPPQNLPEPEASPPVPPPPPARRHFLSNFLKLRFEEKEGVITYRKHYVVLLLQTWKASLLFLVTLILALYLGFSPARATMNGPGWFFIAMIALVSVGWWLYEYADWSNDRFQVTQDQIFDIDRKPFGREERKAASLDNILSTEYRRLNLLQVLFNYGNVYITVGGTQMVFENVANPSAVQQDIDQRRLARLERKRQAEAEAERERMAEWIAAYHRIAQQPPESSPPGPERPGED